MATLVCVLLTRGHPEVEGQGDELLWLTPERYRTKGGDTLDQLEFMLVDKVEESTVKSKDGKLDPALQAAHRLIASNCFLNAEKYLRLIRRSKRVPWGGAASYLIAFLFRMSDSYERGLEYAWAQGEAGQAGFGDDWPGDLPQNEGQQLMVDVTMYRLVETKLGSTAHGWETWDGIDQRAEAMKVEFISTAFYLVILPPVLSSALHIFSSVKPPIPADAAEQALNVFFKVVSSGFARQAFKFWSPNVPPPTLKDKLLPEAVVKHRCYCYWLDVVAFQLRTCNTLLETSISAVFLRVLQVLHPLVNDPQISMDDFEKRALKEIGTELAQSRYATGVLEKLAIGKILEQDIPQHEARRKRAQLQIVTLGHSPLVFGVLRGLMHYLLTTPAHPYSALHPGIGALTREQQDEWLNRPTHTKITILESRPSCSGVVMAERLHAVVEGSAARAKELRAMSKPNGRQGLAMGIRDRIKQHEIHREDDGVESEGGSLTELVNSVDSPDPECNVTIEVIPDLGIVQALRNSSPGDIIVLIPAERVLPNTSDTLGPLGSFMLAWCGHEAKAKVFAIASTEIIATSPLSDSPPGDPAELTAGWKESSGPASAVGVEAMNRFAAKVVDKKVTTIRTTHQPSEVVLHQLIETWITENGVLSAAGCALLGRERARAEKAIYGDEEQ